MFTVVWNRATAYREEFLILGGAREDSRNTTGIFHTGAKKALVALRLLGLEAIVASSDDRGDYFYWVIDKPTSVGDVVIGVISTDPADPQNREIHELSYTTSIASHAWLEGFNGNPYVRAFGQFVLNAVGTSDSWGILTNVEEVTPAPAGFTRVYIPQNECIEEITEGMDRYFSFGRSALAAKLLEVGSQDLLVQIFPRLEDASSTIIYVQGALAYSESPIQSRFRYTYGIMGDREGRYLSEERHLRSINDAQALLARFYERAVFDGDRDILRYLVRALPEQEGRLNIWANSDALRDAFIDEYGPRAVITSYDLAAFLSDKLKRPVIGAGPAMCWSLESSGIKRATEVDGLRGGRRESRLNKRQTQQVARDVQFLEVAGLASTSRSVEYFRFENLSPNDGTEGLNHTRDGIVRIGIRRDLLNSADDRRRVLIHEHRHLLTGHQGHYGRFADRAEKDLLRLAEEVWRLRR